MSYGDFIAQIYLSINEDSYIVNRRFILYMRRCLSICLCHKTAKKKSRLINRTIISTYSDKQYKAEVLIMISKNIFKNTKI